MLSFAIIMLNTDAHNPLAERRLTKPDFVLMNYQQTEEGMEPVLPAAEVEAIYDRITAQEIVVRGDGPSSNGAASANGAAPAAHRAAARNRLAAALGLTQLALPFRALAGWDKAKGVETERRHLMELAEKEVARAAMGTNVWHTATHAEHTRPMLQVRASTCIVGSARDGLCHHLRDIYMACCYKTCWPAYTCNFSVMCKATCNDNPALEDKVILGGGPVSVVCLGLVKTCVHNLQVELMHASQD
jgi:hypothetical protein